MTFAHERLPDDIHAQLVIACYDERVVECPEEQAEEGLLCRGGYGRRDGRGLNPGLDPDHPERVPVEVDVEIAESWGGE